MELNDLIPSWLTLALHSDINQQELSIHYLTEREALRNCCYSSKVMYCSILYCTVLKLSSFSHLDSGMATKAQISLFHWVLMDPSSIKLLKDHKNLVLLMAKSNKSSDSIGRFCLGKWCYRLVRGASQSCVDCLRRLMTNPVLFPYKNLVNHGSSIING